jgi:hypothetical protein
MMGPDELIAFFPAADGETLQMVCGLLAPFDGLVRVHCRGVDLQLPDRNSLWRGLQCWGMLTGRLTTDFSKFCLAGNCRQCATTIRRAGAEPEVVLACKAEPEPGMEILELAEGFELRT